MTRPFVLASMVSGILLWTASATLAQEMPMPPGMQMPMPSEHQHEMPMPENPLGVDMTRDGSGTSWLPSQSPMPGTMRQRGAWMLMLHGNGFVQYIDTASDRGDRQFGSINWIMGMAQRPLRGGQFAVRTMFSADPLTVGRCGYPNLLQTGEFCREARLHDRQHPHDMFMELAVDYRRALSKTLAFEVYGGTAGDPALGPTAYPHRPSAMPNPVAPIGHHWLDASHISFGVMTGAVYSQKWKAEASVFNGREPDDRRYNIDLAAMDSYSARFWMMPTNHWAIQVSAGHLTAADIDTSGQHEDVDRVTTSATYHRIVNGHVWATTAALGWNREADHATTAALAEMALDLTAQHTVFARAEVVGKTDKDLVLPAPAIGTLAVGKVGLGYTRWFPTTRGIKSGLGGGVGIALFPSSLVGAYGGRAAGEFSVFLTLRPR